MILINEIYYLYEKTEYDINKFQKYWINSHLLVEKIIKSRYHERWRLVNEFRCDKMCVRKLVVINIENRW